MSLVVNITRNGDQIIIAPAKLSVPFNGTTPQKVQWRASGNVKITGVEILGDDPPITTPEEINDQEWRAFDTNNNQTGSPQTYEYVISIDPEIENDSKPPGDRGEDRGDAGGGHDGTD